MALLALPPLHLERLEGVLVLRADALLDTLELPFCAVVSGSLHAPVARAGSPPGLEGWTAVLRVLDTLSTST